MTNKRFEIKFVVKNLDKDIVKQHILRNPYSFAPAFEPRIVNNIYYDTFDGRSLHQNLNGNNVRTKYRIRWYNDDYKTAILETKYKENLLGWKDYLKIENQLDFRNTKALYLPDQPLINSLGMTKSMQNKYLRSYFISLDGRYRFTIDSNIETADLHHPNTTMPQKRKIVIELKFDEGNYEGALNLLSFFPYRQVKNSKFVTGVNAQNK